MAKKKRKKQKPKPRSAVALTMAKRRRNSGPFKDRKKESVKMACRAKIKED